MELQQKIIEQYLRLKGGKPTLKEIGDDTGIQVTRVFRIMNGAEMKLSEYQKFEAMVKELMGEKHSLETLAKECSRNLSPQGMKEVCEMLKRKLAVWELAKLTSTSSVQLNA